MRGGVVSPGPDTRSGRPEPGTAPHAPPWGSATLGASFWSWGARSRGATGNTGQGQEVRVANTGQEWIRPGCCLAPSDGETQWGGNCHPGPQTRSWTPRKKVGHRLLSQAAFSGSCGGGPRASGLGPQAGADQSQEPSAAAAGPAGWAGLPPSSFHAGDSGRLFPK